MWLHLKAHGSPDDVAVQASTGMLRRFPSHPLTAVSSVRYSDALVHDEAWWRFIVQLAFRGDSPAQRKPWDEMTAHEGNDSKLSVMFIRPQNHGSPPVSGDTGD